MVTIALGIGAWLVEPVYADVITSYSIHYTKLYDQVAVDARRREGPGGRRHEEESRIVMGFEREASRRGHVSQLVRKDVAGLHQAEAVGVVCADVAGAECESAAAQIERAGVLDHVAEASVITSYSIHYTKLYDFAFCCAC